MTFFKPCATIFWKEYRQQISLALALLFVVLGFHAFTVVIYTMTTWQETRSFAIEPGVFYIFALIFSTVYTTCSASMVYSQEQEERTFSMLRNLPISRGQLLLGKSGWVLLSSLVFFVLNLLLALLMIYLFSGQLDMFDFFNIKHWRSYLEAAYSWEGTLRFLWLVFVVISCHLFGCILAPFCWGLFWSTRGKSVMNTILATLGSMLAWYMLSFAVMGVIKFLSREVFWFRDSATISEVALFLCLVGGTFFIGAVGLFLAYYWFDIWKDRKTLLADWRPPIEDNKGIRRAEYAMAKDLGNYKRGEFWTLFFHAIRQSKGLFLAMFVFGTVTSLLMLLFFAEVTMNKNYAVGFGSALVSLDIFFLYIFAANIFTADQKTHAAFLGDRGVSPGKIWWSRVLPFGLAYFGTIAAVFVCMCLSILFFNYSTIATGTSSYISGQWITSFEYHRNNYNVEWVLPFLIYTIPPFFAGIFVSMFTRSGIVATCGTLALAFLMIGWGALTQTYVGVFTFWNGNLFPGLWKNPVLWWLDFTAVWCIAPIVIGWLVASRLRTADWLRGRSLWKSHAVLAWIIVPFLAVCVAIPFYRVYTVPKTDTAYLIPRKVIANLEFDPLEGDLKNATSSDFITSSPDFETLRLRYEIVRNSYTNPKQSNIAARHPFVEIEVLQRLDTMFPDLSYTMGGSDVIRIQRLDGTLVEVNDVEVVPEEILDEAIKLVEKMPSAPFLPRVRRFYEFAQYAQLHDKEALPPVFRYLPWEKTRLLRQFSHGFQAASQIAEKIDSLETELQKNPGAYESLMEQIDSNFADNEFTRLYRDLETHKLGAKFARQNITGLEWYRLIDSHELTRSVSASSLKPMYRLTLKNRANFLLRAYNMKKQPEEPTELEPVETNDATKTE